MIYTRKPISSTIIKFECTAECIRELRLILGGKLVGVSKSVDTFNKAILKVDHNGKRLIIKEGEYIISNDVEGVYSLTEEEFNITHQQGPIELITDGYHSFKELYQHRCILFSVICNSNKELSWKSKKHADGSMFKDYFIVGINTKEGSFTYHYHIDEWDRFKVKELDNAPEWDGHTSQDITRLESLCL